MCENELGDVAICCSCFEGLSTVFLYPSCPSESPFDFPCRERPLKKKEKEGCVAEGSCCVFLGQSVPQWFGVLGNRPVNCQTVRSKDASFGNTIERCHVERLPVFSPANGLPLSPFGKQGVTGPPKCQNCLALTYFHISPPLGICSDITF